MATRKNIGKDDSETESDNFPNGKILVIDDEPSIRKSLRGILRKHNYSVETAGDYEEAKEQLFKGNYDALILDILLPGVNGIDILHNINRSNINLPTIMLTGVPNLITAQKSVKYGAFDYLTKPVDQNVLLNQLRNAVAKKKLTDSRDELVEQLQMQKNELEKLVDQRTKELKISEMRYRVVCSSIHDIILITNAKGLIIYSNSVFLDYISEASGKDINFSFLEGKAITDFIEEFEDLKWDYIIEKLKEGKDLQLAVKFESSLNLNSKFYSSIRGIFDEDLVLNEIILTIEKK